jgi:hypothetical protein
MLGPPEADAMAVRQAPRAVLASAAGLLLLAGACATPVPRHEVDRLADAALEAAEGHLRDGNPSEAGYLTEAVLRADPDHPRAAALLARIEAEGPVLREPLLGSNQPLRAPARRPPALRALLYLPDRLLDLVDVASFDLHLGFGLYANVHATRALQAALGVRGVTGVGWHERRSLGLREQQDTGVVLVAFGAESTSGRTSGTSGIFAWAETLAGLQDPEDVLYQEVRDYWALGGAVTVLVLGLDVDLHPLQVADFAAGWAGVDFLRDDLASTRALALTRHEKELLRDLQEASGARAAPR